MAKQKFGLGRGLDALISGASEVISAQQQSGQAASDALPLLPIESIIPNPQQPRRTLRDDDPRLLELSSSIKEHGLLQPIVVKRLEQADTEAAPPAWFSAAEEQPQSEPEQPAPQYQIIAGERRWRAARLAGLKQVPVVIKEVTPQQMLELGLIENIQRSDLNPIEEALAYQTLIQEYGLTQEKVARQVGKDRSTIANSLRLLQLPEKIREALVTMPDTFTEGHARALLGLANEEDQLAVMNQVISLRMSVRQTEELVARMKQVQEVASEVKPASLSEQRAAELETWEEQFRNALMVKVELKCNQKGKGTLVLHFNDQDELERLYNRILNRGQE